MTPKATPLCLLRILEEYTDSSHILSRRELEELLCSVYDIKPDRRTVYSTVDLLNHLGYDISDYKQNGKGYYLRERVLDPTEVHLLSDAVCALPFISEDQTKRLIDKLQKLVSTHERRHIRNLSIDRSGCKTVNKTVFFNIEMLDEAIEKRVQVTFDYCSYGPDKQLHSRRDRPYTVSPYRLVYNNEHYYLICLTEGKTNPGMYRLDRIRNIALTDQPREDPSPDFSAESLVHDAVYAFVGEAQPVTLRIDRGVLGDVIDKFGTDIIVGEESDGDKLLVTLHVSVKGLRYWAMQYLEHVEVLTPASLREEITETLKHNPYTAE